MTALAHRLRRLAGTYEAAALAALRHPANTPTGRLGIQAALTHLHMAASYYAAANEQDQK